MVYHKKILISKTRELDYEKVKVDIDSLCITNRFQSNNIVLKMKNLIPEYKSNNSYFQKFDKRLSSDERSTGLKPQRINKNFIDL